MDGIKSCPNCHKIVSSNAEKCCHCHIKLKGFSTQQLAEGEVKKVAGKVDWHGPADESGGHIAFHTGEATKDVDKGANQLRGAKDKKFPGEHEERKEQKLTEHKRRAGEKPPEEE